MRPRIITLLTDFGSRDPYAGIMKGVILGIAPEVRFVDLTHEIPPQDVTCGALLLRSCVGAFPRETMHLAIVDPGVGSARLPIVVEAEAGLLIGPDNGILALAASEMGACRFRVIENTSLFRTPLSRTFHGRDIFAPVAAHIAAGLPLADVGREIQAMRQLDLPAPSVTPASICGEVLHVDHFGNLVTNISASDLSALSAKALQVRIGDAAVSLLHETYSVVPVGAPLAHVGSWGLVEIAVRDGSAAARFGHGRGAVVTIELA